MSDSPRIFADFVEGRTNETQCRQLLSHDPLWLARFETCVRLQRVAKAPQYDAIPNVDTRGMFQAQWGKRATAASDFWPKLAVAASFMAIAISLSPLKLQLSDGSVAVRWTQQDPKQLEQQVSTLLASYRVEQQEYLQKHLQLQQQQQASQLILLKDYMTESEQKNRRSDMLELVEYLNMQRQADWQYWQDHAQPSQARLDYSAAPSYKRQP